MRGYNGFRNYETWVMSVRLLNDAEYGVQVRAMRDEVGGTDGLSLEENLREYVAGHPDRREICFGGLSLEMVRWGELVRVLRAEAMILA